MYYHGTSKNIDVGDFILPPSKTGVQSEESRKKNLNKVFFTEDQKHAKVYADKASNNLGGTSKVYVVEPVGDVVCLNDTPGCTTFMADKAKVVDQMDV